MLSCQLYIFGTGAHARKVYHSAILAGFMIKAFVDDNQDALSPVELLPVIHSKVLKQTVEFGCIFIAVGNSNVRRRLMEDYLQDGWEFPVIIHPHAYIAPDTVLNCGVLVAAGSVVESGSVIGIGSIVDIGVIIDHDCLIEPYSHLRPGVVCQAGTYWSDEII